MNEMKVPFHVTPGFGVASRAEPEADGIDLLRLWAMVRRQLPLVAFSLLCSLLIGVAYLATTPAIYTASASVMVEDQQGRLLEEASPVPAAQRTEAMILSEIEILRSTHMANTVAKSLSIWENDAFMNPPRSAFARLVDGLFAVVRGSIASLGSADDEAVLEGSSSKPTNESDRNADKAAAALRLAAFRLQNGLTVQRSGRSYAIAIGFSSHSPKLAQDIANAYVEAYRADALQTSFETTKRAASWMQERLEELETDTRTASLEAERFRAEKGLTSSRGVLVPEQQLSDFNSQLALARGDTGRARAQLSQAQSVLGRPPEEAIAAAVFVADGEPINATLAQLRETYLKLAAREREVTAGFGKDHPQATALRRERAELSEAIMRELASTVESLKNAYQTSQARETALLENVANATGQNTQASQDQVKLRELEQRADTYAKLHEAYLGRFAEISKQQTFPVAKVRVLSEARLPQRKSGPSTTKVLGALLIFGAGIGGAAGAVRELRERFLRTEDDVRNSLGARFLGYAPNITTRNVSPADDAEGNDPPGWVADTVAVARMLATLSSPSSMLAETVRTVRTAIDVHANDVGAPIIGVVSMLPGEGKSTIAANLAAQIASSGVNVLLVDADIRKPSITRALAPKAEQGIVEGVLGSADWTKILHRVHGTSLAVAPSVMTGRVVHTSEVLTSKPMCEFLARARQSFAYVILDLPPVAPVSDASAMAPYVDGFLLVTQWGKTPRALIRNQLRAEPAIADKLLGVVLNQVDMKRLRRYDDDGGQAYFSERYGDYHTDETAADVKV